MKINVIAVVGLSLFGSGHAEVVSEASREVSNFQRQLGITFENSCTSSTGDDECCVYDSGSACSQQDQVSNDFELIIPKGSCHGRNPHAPCLYLGIVTMGEYSCVGSGTCSYAGFTDDGVSGKATIGSNSCKGRVSCWMIGRNGEATIGADSCISDSIESDEPTRSCYKAGESGKVVIGDNSCNGRGRSCEGAGSSLIGEATIGTGSCNGDRSCHVIRGSFTIGDNSCNGDSACEDRNDIVIGSGSCNCPNCCSCLASGAIVPDNKCNSQGACCDGNTKTVDIVIEDNDTITPPTPPTLPGATPQGSQTTYDAAPEYDIALSSCEFTPNSVGSDIGEITCTFTTLGGVDYSVSSTLYNADCSSAGAPTGVSQDSSTSFSPALVNGSTTQESSTYSVTISLASSAARPDSDNIAFCLKSEVKDKDEDVYDWIGQKIKLDVKLDGTFSTDSLSTTTFDGTTENAADAGDVTFGVGVKRCDSNGKDVTDDTKLSLGENFFLCVEGDQSAVVINSIRELKAKKDDVTDLNLVTTVGDGSGEGDRNSNTFVYGYGSNEVVIATRLSASFFVAGGSVTLSGTANISTGSGRRRLSGRSVQEASASSEKESAGFSMELKVAGSSDASGASKSTIKAAATVFFGAVAAAVFV